MACQSGDGVNDGPNQFVVDEVEQCDVIIAGGTTAALSAALTSAREGSLTCLLEPTNWPGGQLTAGGVPAVDFAWHTHGNVNVREFARHSANIPAEFLQLIQQAVQVPQSKTGTCTVSQYCFMPAHFLDILRADAINPVVATGNLKIFYDTVVKSVVKDRSVTGPISSLTAIRRTPVNGNSAANATAGYEVFLSEQLEDWYSPEDSARFRKRTIEFQGRSGRLPVVIDATEFGDVLALSTSSFLQGVEVSDGSRDILDSTCGQATVFPFIEKYNPTYTAEPVNPNIRIENPDYYGFKDPEEQALGCNVNDRDFDYVWTYRRLWNHNDSTSHRYDLTLQNWLPGNDYPFGYLFLDKDSTMIQALTDWKGGINMTALAGAEAHAYGWHYFYRAQDPRLGRTGEPRPSNDHFYVTMERDKFGTTYGLSKMPYLRDTRRSIGIDDFVLASSQIRGDGITTRTGERFADSVAIGAYVMDFHFPRTCEMPQYIKDIKCKSEESTLPFYIPFRALTNRDVSNLLVAGKTMAQSFVANSATRLQPIEWSAGIGAGAAAAHMAQTGKTSTLTAHREEMAGIQNRIRKHAPIEWTTP